MTKEFRMLHIHEIHNFVRVVKSRRLHGEDENETECAKNLVGKPTFKFHLKIRQDIGRVMYAIFEE